MARIYTETVPSEHLQLDGKIYRRYPQSPRRHLRNYFTRSGRFYHIDLWAKHNGPVPDGCHIHHKDHNPLNNDIGNLECLSMAKHAAAHPERRERSNSPEQHQHLERIRPLTKAWHASPEGLAWHAENGRNAWANRKPTSLVCQHCGGVFESLIHGAKFCGRSCGNKQWMLDHPGYNAEKKARQKARLQLDGS